MPDSAPCPYCGVMLSPAPTRKKKCPHCGQIMFVRRGNPLTEVQTAEYDEDQRIEAFVMLFSRFGVTRKEFDLTRERLTCKFGTRAPENDVKWAILLSLVGGQRDPYDKVYIYNFMIGILLSENRPTEHITRERNKWYKEHVRREFIRDFPVEYMGRPKGLRWFVQITTCGDDKVCDACKGLDGKLYTRKEFQETMPIADHCQSAIGCRCSFVLKYQSSVDEDDWTNDPLRLPTSG